MKSATPPPAKLSGGVTKKRGDKRARSPPAESESDEEGNPWDDPADPVSG